MLLLRFDVELACLDGSHEGSPLARTKYGRDLLWVIAISNGNAVLGYCHRYAAMDDATGVTVTIAGRLKSRIFKLQIRHFFLFLHQVVHPQYSTGNLLCLTME